MPSEPSELGTTIVTGGSSGLGAAVVNALVGAGTNPVVIDIRQPAGDVEFEQCDLGDRDAAARATRAAIGRHPDLSAIVTCTLST